MGLPIIIQMLVLRNKLAKLSASVIKPRTQYYFNKLALPFCLASGTSLVFYQFMKYYGQKCNEEYEKYIARVEGDEQVHDFLNTFEPNNLEDFIYKKVEIQGILRRGRFFVKRKRGDQQGYIILAPFVVGFQSVLARSPQRKFVLNLGWVPKADKQLLPGSTKINFLTNNQAEKQTKQQDENDDQAQDQEKESNKEISKIYAYIRPGEEQSRWRGRRKLFKFDHYSFIDLDMLSKIFRMNHNARESETIYLDHLSYIAEDFNEFPVPLSKEQMSYQLRQKMKEDEEDRDTILHSVIGGVFGASLLATLL